MSVIALGYVGLNVSDVPAWKTWAQQFLGAMPGPMSPAGEERLRFDEHAWRIALEHGDRDDIAYAGFEVAGPAELAALKARLAGAGLEVEEGDAGLIAERGVMGLLRCRDPEGLAIEIYYGPTHLTDTPFVSPVGGAVRHGRAGAGPHRAFDPRPRSHPSLLP